MRFGIFFKRWRQRLRMAVAQQSGTCMLSAIVDPSAAAGAPEPGPATDAGGRRLAPSQRPWWESDSRFAERFHSVDESSE